MRPSIVRIGLTFTSPGPVLWDNTEGHKQSRRFLECVYDNFLLQMLKEPIRTGPILDLILTNKKGLVGTMK